MAHLSEDKNMIDAFLSNHDIHAATAAQIYKIDLKDVGSDMRRKSQDCQISVSSMAYPYLVLPNE